MKTVLLYTVSIFPNIGSLIIFFKNYQISETLIIVMLTNLIFQLLSFLIPIESSTYQVHVY